MPSFHVKYTFEVASKRLFVIAGSIVEGEIRNGIFVHIPFNSSFELTARIHSIEFARREGGEDVCLCIRSEAEDLALWRGLNHGDETLEITETGSE